MEDHTRHVREEAERLLAARPFWSQKYRRFTGNDLGELLLLCAQWHDQGKAHPKWQNACRLDYELSLQVGKSEGRHLQKSKVRHEMESLVRANAENVALTRPGYAAIAAHHRKLGERYAKRWNEDDGGRFGELWKWLRKWSGELRGDQSADFERAIRLRYQYSGPRALLQLADGRASAKEALKNEDEARQNGGWPPDLVLFSYKFPHASPRGVQKLVQEVWDEPFAILRAPTGGGKTDAALLWANHQIENGRADRLIIAMPTRFTSNALAVAVAESLSQTGLYHSSAWQNYPRGVRDAQLRLAREVLSPLTVTTLDHLCIALTGAREDHHSIFWNLAHSCIVVDEADFYDDFTQRNLVVLLRVLKALEVPVLIMSATVPDSARDLYALSGQTTSQIHDSSEGKERVRCRLMRCGVVERPDDVGEFLERALNGEPTIFYCNTVKRAQEFYAWFQSRDALDVVLYHSRFTEEDKIKIEEQLRAMLGKEAWEEERAHGVAILTQIGELSVNISADLMFSDVCPVDRLAQRVGRLSRFRDEPGELFLMEPHKTNKTGETLFYPAPYGTYVTGKGWEETEPLRQSRALLQDGDYSAARFVEMVDVIYPQVNEPAARARLNQRKLERLFVTNWLIIPKAQMAEDDEDFQDGEWRSRDVPPQKTIFVAANDSTLIDETERELEFLSYGRFREWSQKRGIAVYTHEFNQAMQEGKIQKRIVTIGDDTEEIFTVSTRYYSDRIGLHFSEEADETEIW